MKNKIRSAWFVLTCCFVVFPLIAFASDNPEVYVVTTDIYGNSSYNMSNGDGTFTENEELITFSDWRSYSYSNAVGDFDNDGDFDLILARGKSSGYVYVFEKIGAGNQFVQRNIETGWTEGKYPAGAVVADFNEDDQLDFIMTYYLSTNCSLYEGDGNFGFTESILAATAPSISFGADAADFNNDGHADFVVVPYYSAEELYINLGNGDGTFHTIKNESYSSNGYWDVAAADFNRDGNVDLVATSNSFMDVYYGNGDGTFAYQYRIADSGIYDSPVDNFDFNADGHQDLVIGAYTSPSLSFASNSNGEGIAVFFGDGEGTFGDPVVYGVAAIGGYVTTISAPPPIPNREPVAMINCARSEVTAGQTFEVDGSGSYDEDGTIISYQWDFGDGSDDAQGDIVQHVYDEAGEYTITLTVTDDRKATNRAEVTMLVVPRATLAAKIKFVPRVLNLKSRGRWIWAFARLPKGYHAHKVEINSLLIDDGGSQRSINLADSKKGIDVKTHRKHARRGIFRLKIDRQLVADAITGDSDKVVLGIQGEVLHNGDPVEFVAEDTIRVIHPVKKKPKWRHGGKDNDDDDDDDDDEHRHRHR